MTLSARSSTTSSPNRSDPQPRDPGVEDPPKEMGDKFSPPAPRPPKPIQPREAATYRSWVLEDPNPRDPGRKLNTFRTVHDPTPRDSGYKTRTFMYYSEHDSSCQYQPDSPPRDERPPVPRDGGKKTRRLPVPRDICAFSIFTALFHLLTFFRLVTTIKSIFLGHVLFNSLQRLTGLQRPQSLPAVSQGGFCGVGTRHKRE